VYTIEFEADVKNGMIKLPEELKNLESQRLVIKLSVTDNLISSSADTVSFSDEYIKKNWEKLLSESLADFSYNDETWKYEYGSYLAEKNR